MNPVKRPLVAVALALAPVPLLGQLAAPPSRTWNLRGTGAGNFKIVLDVSGRDDVALYFESRNPKDLPGHCEASKATDRAAIAGITARVSALEASGASLDERVIARQALAQVHAYAGDMVASAEAFEAAYELLAPLEDEAGPVSEARAFLEEAAGVANLRRGEVDNCVLHHNAERCIFPVAGRGVHKDLAGSTRAVEFLSKAFARDRTNLEIRWLLNVAYMTLGRYPAGVPADVLIPPERFASEAPQARFADVALSSGVDIRTRAGGTVVEDVDGDGDRDLVMTSLDPCEPVRYYRNRGDGYFDDGAAAAGLAGQTGGLNLTQTDYDNDGRIDLFIHRGGWEGFPSRNSLLRQNADGTFTDVTDRAGLLAGPSHRTHSAAWADYDSDGWLDVFEGHEDSPSALYHNERDGTFRNVAATAGVARVAITKGAAWGDYDNDGRPDLYVSNFASRNFLYRNRGDGTFEEVAERLGVARPIMSFATWFFDYDNDGALDLFVANYVPSVTEIARGLLGMPPEAETTRLYRNTGRGGFEDVSVAAGMARVTQAMGANFGDIDNDGFPDVYLGTGAPSYASIVPNVLLRNDGGRRYLDVTTASGTGHLQKGHGVGFGDLDGDGAEDLVVNVGGFVPGDAYWKTIFRNPGTPNHWIDVRLVGVRSNRPGIGASIDAWIRDAAGRLARRHVVVSTGGSFGSSSLTQHIGLGPARVVERLEIAWPASGIRQAFTGVAADRRVVVREDADRLDP
jgi:hypothetical protein